MKIIKRLLFFILSVLLISSCQKELDFEDVGGGISAGTLKKDVTFECFPSTVAGQYITDSTLTNENFIDVQVNLTNTGSYTIQSDTSNGYSFKGTGTLGGLGLNTVRLYGSGIPILPGTDQFIIHYDTSICIIDVNVIPSGVGAEYTFDGAGGTCTGAMINGTYMTGVAMDAGNTAKLALQIITPGNYAITTTQQNGITFSATGIFADTSPQTIILSAQGTPLASGTFVFDVLGNGTSCAFSITFP